MSELQFSYPRSREAILATNKVLRNTYLLLALTLLFSSLTAGVAMATNAPPMGLLSLLVMFGLLFAVQGLRNSPWGIVMVFAFTGFMGFTLGPLLNFYLATAAGTQTVVTALGLTGLIFLSLSGYVLTTRKDFSFMRGFLFTGLMVVLGSMLIFWVAGMFGYYFPALNLAISAAIVMLMCGLILFDTSRIIHGGETNYIMATVSLYLDIYNLFVNLLALLSAFGGNNK